MNNAKLMKVAPLRDQTLHQIAMVQFQAGNFQDAMTTAALMETGQHRDEVLAKLVNAFRQAWNLRDALRAAKQVGNDDLRREKFHAIALAQIAAKDYEGALATAELSRAPTNPYRDEVLARVVDTYREAWNLQDALSIAEQVGQRQRAPREVVRHCLGAGDSQGLRGCLGDCPTESCAEQ